MPDKIIMDFKDENKAEKLHNNIKVLIDKLITYIATVIKHWGLCSYSSNLPRIMLDVS